MIWFSWSVVGCMPFGFMRNLDLAQAKEKRLGVDCKTLRLEHENVQEKSYDKCFTLHIHEPKDPIF